MDNHDRVYSDIAVKVIVFKRKNNRSCKIPVGDFELNVLPGVS